jgi:hypothetical protein
MWEYKRYKVGDEAAYGKIVLQVKSCYDCANCPLKFGIDYYYKVASHKFKCPVTKHTGTVQRGFFCKRFKESDYIQKHNKKTPRSI